MFAHIKHKTVSNIKIDSEFNDELTVWLNADNILFSNIKGIKELNMKKNSNFSNFKER